jgi:hypothetical protein
LRFQNVIMRCDVTPVIFAYETKSNILQRRQVTRWDEISYHRHFNLLSGIAPYFVILLCPSPDDFSRQEGSAGPQLINQTNLPICLVNRLSGIAP